MVSCRVVFIQSTVVLLCFIISVCQDQKKKEITILTQGHEMPTRNPTSVNRKYVTLFVLCQSVYKYLWSVH